jgi:hypothetical protein
MIYTVMISYKNINRITAAGVSIDEARDEAATLVAERMEAFGEDREALRQYGYLDAEQQALDAPEHGCVIHLSDGRKIEIIPEDDIELLPPREM